MAVAAHSWKLLIISLQILQENTELFLVLSKFMVVIMGTHTQKKILLIFWMNQLLNSLLFTTVVVINIYFTYLFWYLWFSPLTNRLFSKLINFNWRIITSQHYNGFSHTSGWIGHMYKCVAPSWTLLPLSSPSYPSGLFLEQWLWLPCFMHLTCTGHLFYTW